VGKIWYGKRKTDPVSGKLIAQDKKTWTIVEGEHDAIISDDIFEKAQNLLSQNKGKPTKSGRTYLLSGIIRCGLCGGAMTGHTFKKKPSQKIYSYYKCYSQLQKGNIACQGLSLPAGELEGFIVEQLNELSKNTTFLSDKKKMLKILKSKTDNKGFDVEIQRIDKEYKNLNDRKDTLLEKLERKLISDEDFQSRYERINNDMATFDQEKTRIIALGNSRRVALNSLELSFEEISSFGHSWEYLDDAGKAMRIRSIVKEIRATKENIDLDIYLDVAKMSHTDRDSWRPPA
jgi:site-specific DNA recombinase